MGDKGMLKKAVRTSMEFTKVGVVSGVGASVIGSAGGDAGVMTGFTKHLPTVGSVEGAGMVIGSLKKLKRY